MVDSIVYRVAKWNREMHNYNYNQVKKHTIFSLI